MTYNSEYDCQDVIPDIQQTLCSSSRREPLKDIRFSCILALHQLTIRDFLQKRLNPQKPKESRIHLMAQTKTGTTWLLPLWLSERKTPRDIVHSEQWSNLCDTVNFLWNSGDGTEKSVQKPNHETVLRDEERWRILHQMIKQASNYLYCVNFLTWITNFPTPIASSFRPDMRWNVLIDVNDRSLLSGPLQRFCQPLFPWMTEEFETAILTIQYSAGRYGNISQVLNINRQTAWNIVHVISIRD
jgi:hypothetical protein